MALVISLEIFPKVIRRDRDNKPKEKFSFLSLIRDRVSSKHRFGRRLKSLGIAERVLRKSLLYTEGKGSLRSLSLRIGLQMRIRINMYW